MSPPRELIDREQRYELVSDAEGNYFLEVLCGGVGMYEVRIELTEAQVARYHEAGREFLHELALRVRKGGLRDQVVKR